MILKQYKNEFIVVISFLFLIFAIIYKNIQVSGKLEDKSEIKQSINEFKELIVLKKRWADKSTSKKIEKLKNITSSSKLKWSKKGKKLSASYNDLNSKELNRVVTVLLNLPVEIQQLNIKNSDLTYSVELKCKW